MKQIKTYKEPKWVRLRETALRRDKYTDQYLKRYGKNRQAEVVHHIFPVADFPEYQYELWNLISVTKSTHNSFHIRNSDDLSKKGKELLVYTATKNNIRIPYEYLDMKRPVKNVYYDYY